MQSNTAVFRGMRSVSSSYITIRRRGESRYEEKKSVFWGFAAPVSTEGEALSLISEIKGRYPDARHHVYAYLLRDRSLMRYSDDREPQGTAGMPTLDAIRKSGIVDAAVVTVRYFGGTLLGTGGLVRAYGRAAAEALRAAQIISMQPFRRLELLLSYADYPKIAPLLSRRAIPILGSDFGVDVRLSVRLPDADTPAFLAELTELTAGRALFSMEELFFDGVPIEATFDEKNE